jgi:hypothetical protein
MTQLTFYPLNNADTSFIELTNGRTILVDYAHCIVGEEEAEPIVDLKTTLKEKLDSLGLNEIDTVLFTHADQDHVRNASEFFWFQHAKEYQGEDRIKIKELWVPAAFICEEGLDDCARVIRQEARHRLRQGSGIRVFSWPQQLEGWLKDNGLSLQSRQHLITDAGNIAPGFSLAKDQVEFFVHSPFAHRDADTLQSRNDGSVFMQATFQEGGRKTRLMLGADTEHEVLAEIVRITKNKNREDRLEWEIFKLPHHCSYGVLSAEKGENETVPDAEVLELFEKGSIGLTIVSPSKPIPDEDTKQPPHMQAANFYKKLAKRKFGQFIVTMEHPFVSAPAPLEMTISEMGAQVVRNRRSISVSVAAVAAPRAGCS